MPKTQKNSEIYNSGECYFTRGWLLTYFLGGCSAQITPSNRDLYHQDESWRLFFARVCEKFPENLCTLFWFSKKIFFFTWKYFPNKQKPKRKKKLSSQIWKRIWFTFPQPPIAANREALPLLRRKWNVSLCSFFTMGVMRIFSGFAITCLTLVA